MLVVMGMVRRGNLNIRGCCVVVATKPEAHEPGENQLSFNCVGHAVKRTFPIGKSLRDRSKELVQEQDRDL